MGKRLQILTLQKHVYMHLMHRSPFLYFICLERARQTVRRPLVQVVFVVILFNR